MKEDIRPVKFDRTLVFSEGKLISSILAVPSENYTRSENVLEIAPDVGRQAARRLSISMHAWRKTTHEKGRVSICMFTDTWMYSLPHFSYYLLLAQLHIYASINPQKSLLSSADSKSASANCSRTKSSKTHLKRPIVLVHSYNRSLPLK